MLRSGSRVVGVPVLVLVPVVEDSGVRDALERSGGRVLEFCARAGERAIPANSINRTNFCHDMGDLSSGSQTRTGKKNCCSWSRSGVAYIYGAAEGGREAVGQPELPKADAIIKNCTRRAVRSGRVAQLAEQLTLNQ